jgi:predicted ATPase/class 3 adenylate cyclase
VGEEKLPRGSVTFLFTDIEGSTQLFRRIESLYPVILRRHHAILEAAISGHGGVVIETEGDGCFAAFGGPAQAVSAAVAAQLQLAREPWPGGATVRVRMGVHTGAAVPADGTYTALAVHRAARVSAAAHGGQLLCSAATASALGYDKPESEGHDVAERPILLDLGPYILKDFPEPEHLFQVTHEALQRDFPPPRAQSPRRHNLPVQPTAFIGRHVEVLDVRRQVSQSRLVTITGSGGAGKTRLALEVAAQLVPDFSDGAWLVELAGLPQPDLVATAVAAALAVPAGDLDPIDAITEALGPQHLLLVLDNCEHVLDPCAELVDRLLRSCEGVRILTTSRERIGIAAETVWRVPSLAVPDAKITAIDVLLEHDAVRLFDERARHVLPDFVLSGENAPALVELCRRLDGIPLAIELAAARVGSLEPAEIARRLDSRLDLLSRGDRAALPRHRTLRAALEWSFQLLAPSEQELFDRLGIFAGSWSLGATEAICSGSGTGLELLDDLSRLVDCSLVNRVGGSGESRFGMLESVRELARAHLAEMPSPTDLHERHLAYYAELAERAELSGAEQRPWFDRLHADHDNVRAALAYACSAPGRGEVALRMAGRLAPFWRLHGDLAEGFLWLERSLALAGGDSPERATGLLGAGGLAVTRGDYAVARRMLEESIERFRSGGEIAGAARAALDLAWVAWHEGDLDQAGQLVEGYLAVFDDAEDSKGLADVHRMLGAVAAERHDLEKATSHLERALHIFQRICDGAGAAAALSSLGITAEYRGDLVAACELMSDSLAIARECGDERRIAGALDNLGFFWQQRGDLDRARALHSESLAASRAIGDRTTQAAALTNLGSTARQGGALEEARALLGESLRISLETADRSRDVADVLEEIAAVEIAEGSFAPGLTLFAAAETIRESVGYPLREFFRAMYDPLIAEAREQLGEHVEIWEAGRRLSLDAAVAFAREANPSPPATRTAPTATPRRAPQRA